jgi:hypothetical protein
MKTITLGYVLGPKPELLALAAENQTGVATNKKSLIFCGNWRDNRSGMTHRHLVGILTAILRAQRPELDADAAAVLAIVIARVGMSESEAVDAIETITGGTPLASEILLDVDIAIALRDATGLTEN